MKPVVACRRSPGMRPEFAGLNPLWISFRKLDDTGIRNPHFQLDGRFCIRQSQEQMKMRPPPASADRHRNVTAEVWLGERCKLDKPWTCNPRIAADRNDV